jgi:hypothetical protein
MLYSQELSHGTAQTTRQVVLLSRDNAARLRRCLQDGLAIEWLDGMHVQYPDANALACKGPRGAHGHLHHAPARNHRDVTPCPHLGRLAQPEWHRGIRYGRLFDTATEAAVWIIFAVYALLYHSLRVKNTTITESGLFLQDQVHSSHNVPPSKVKSSQKRQVTWRILG